MADRESRPRIETGVDLEHEAKLILQRKELIISPEQKQRWQQDFRQYLRLQNLLGNYAIRTALVGICLVAIAILLLVLLIKNTPAWAYILYGVLGGLFIAGFVLLGVWIRKDRQFRKRRSIAAYIMVRMAQWTQDRLREERNLNRKRFLFENLMNCLFDYVKFDARSSQRNLDAHDAVGAIVNDWHNFDVIVLTYYLFKRVYKNEHKKYDERGFLILMKILSPILNYSTNDELSNLIHNLVREFVKETKINFYTSQIKLVSLSPGENLLLVRRELAAFNIEFELFEDVWRMPLEVRLNRSIIPGSKEPGRQPNPGDGSQSFTNQNVFINNYVLPKPSPRPSLPPAEAFETNQILADRILDERYSETAPGEHQEGESAQQVRNLRDEEPSVIFVIQPDVPPNDFNPGNLPAPPDEPQERHSFKESGVLNASNVNMSQLYGRRSLTTIREIKIPESMKESSVIQDDAVRQLLNIVAEAESTYKVMVKNEKMTILRKTEEGNPVVLIKSISSVDGPADKIFSLIFDLNYRSKWDKVFSNLKIVKILNENTDVMYSFLKAPIFVTDRDFLQKRTCYRNFRGNDFLIAFKSWEDPELPPIKGVIRANTIISGYVIKATGPNHCNLTVVSQTDIKGSIPKGIINAVAAKSPLDWIKRLEQALSLFK